MSNYLLLWVLTWCNYGGILTICSLYIDFSQPRIELKGPFWIPILSIGDDDVIINQATASLLFVTRMTSVIQSDGAFVVQQQVRGETSCKLWNGLTDSWSVGGSWEVYAFTFELSQLGSNLDPAMNCTLVFYMQGDASMSTQSVGLGFGGRKRTRHGFYY